MPAPASATYSVAALVAAHTAFRDLIDGGAGAGMLRIRNSADALLATVDLSDPCGTVNGTTGQLEFSIPGGDTVSTGGTAAYGEFCDSTGAVHLALPAQEGVAAVTGKLVLNSLTLMAGGPLDVIIARVG